MDLNGVTDDSSAQGRERHLQNKVWDDACTEQVFSFIREHKSYLQVSSSVIEHIICAKVLSPTSRLYYLGIDLLSNIEYNSPKRSGKRQVYFSLSASSKLLGIDRTYLLKCQKNLEQKKYFDVGRTGADHNDRLQRNLITPTLPCKVYQQQLEDYPDRVDAKLAEFDETMPGAKRAYLDQTKLFVMINFKMIISVIAHGALSPTAKLIWIYCYLRSYFSQQKNDSLIFTQTIVELSDKIGCGRNTASKALEQLQAEGFISFDFYKKDSANSYRKEKRVLKIGACLPSDILAEIKALPDRRRRVSGVVATAPQSLIESAKKIPAIKTKNTHQIQKTNHPHSKKQPLCNKELTNDLDNKHEGPSGHKVPHCQPVAVIAKESLNVIAQKSLAQEKAVSEKAKKIFNDLNIFVAKCTQLQLSREQQLQMFSNNRLSADDIELLTQEAARINRVVDKMLTEREQSSEQSKQSYQDFLSVLEPYERFLLNEQLNPNTFFLDLKRLNEKVVKKPDTTSNTTDCVRAELGNKDFMRALHRQNQQKLGSEAALHIEHYVNKLYEAKAISGNAAGKTVKQLIIEVTDFVANWQPGKTFINERDKRCFQLTTAGNKLREGRWTTPSACLQADRQQIHFNLQVERTAYGGKATCH